ncbi:MAG: LuxR C-terminal-related transcriptional regulator, partial [Atribacterota bacterium]
KSSQREKEVLRFLVQGKGNETIAREVTVAGCSVQNPIAVPPETLETIRGELNSFFQGLSVALKSNNVGAVLPFYTLPYTYLDTTTGSSVTLTTLSELETFLLNEIMTGTIEEDAFANLTFVNVPDAHTAVVRIDETWVQTYEGETYSATDHLQIHLGKVGGFWKIRKTELLGWD